MYEKEWGALFLHILYEHDQCVCDAYTYVWTNSWIMRLCNLMDNGNEDTSSPSRPGNKHLLPFDPLETPKTHLTVHESMNLFLPLYLQ